MIKVGHIPHKVKFLQFSSIEIEYPEHVSFAECSESISPSKGYINPFDSLYNQHWDIFVMYIIPMFSNIDWTILLNVVQIIETVSQPLSSPSHVLYIAWHTGNDINHKSCVAVYEWRILNVLPVVAEQTTSPFFI